MHHGGSMAGYKSDLMLLPDYGLGAVLLTNSDNGGMLLHPLMRRLVEIAFDGKPEAVEITFEAAVANYIRERVWHESQELEDRPDGSVLLRMSVAPGFELKSWIKGFLPHIQVLKPTALRDEIAADLDQSRKSFPAPARR